MIEPFSAIVQGTVEYDGRAISKTRLGIYLVIVKPDLSIQIHSNTKNKPINYINAKSVELNADQWIFKSKDEQIKVNISNVIEKMSLALLTGVEKKVSKTEQDLVDKLISSMAIHIQGHLYIEPQYPTVVGPIDIVCIDNESKLIHVIEAKRRKPSVNAIYQLKRYIDHIHIEGYEKKGYLAAPEFSEKHDVLMEKFGFNKLLVTFED
jgi:hypothetical protein